MPQLDDLVEIQHGRDRNALLLQGFEAGFPRSDGSKPAFENVLQEIVVRSPGACGRKTRVLQQFGHVESRDELRPLVSERHQRNVAPVTAPEDARWTSVRMLGSRPPLHVFFSELGNARNARFVHVKVGVEQGALDMLPLTSTLAME